MTWMSGSCVSPGEEPSKKVRAIAAAAKRRVVDWERLADTPDPDGGDPDGDACLTTAARWPGHEIGEQ